MSQRLLDVVVDDAFLADLAQVLSGYRNAPVADIAVHSIGAAVKYERALNRDAVQRVVGLMERRRAEAIDLELNGRIDRLQEAHTKMHERLAAREGGG
jgi:RecB family exonuclease